VHRRPNTQQSSLLALTMAGNYSYGRLSAIPESQDIAEYIDTAWRSSESEDSPIMLRNLTSNSDHSTCQRNDTTDDLSLNSSNGSSSSGIEKLKSGWNRIRRKPLPRYLQGSIRSHPAADIEPTRIGRGVWKDQLLVDRSLRGMALLTSLFAITMLVVVCVYAKDFGARANKFSSSIGGATMDCSDVTHTNSVLLFAINVAATMLLGMSNTYQQLVTSLKIGDLKHMLEKYGDSRVGTNSPFNMNHKQRGKRRSWAAWLLLVITSLPIHFLANSLTGPSYIFEPPQTVIYNETSSEDFKNTTLGYSIGDREIIDSRSSFLCWSAFKTGRAHLSEATNLLLEDTPEQLGNPTTGTTKTTMKISYARGNCSGLANTTTDVGGLERQYLSWSGSTVLAYREGNCTLRDSVRCSLENTVPAKCRLNVRMNAAIVLTIALIIKAIYMISVNIIARGRTKQSLLTFGDVIVASASNPELRIQGYFFQGVLKPIRLSPGY
jgi:hypothetical protein